MVSALIMAIGTKEAARMEEAVKKLKENGIRIVKVNERCKRIEIARADSEKYIGMQEKIGIEGVTVCWRYAW